MEIVDNKSKRELLASALKLLSDNYKAMASLSVKMANMAEREAWKDYFKEAAVSIEKLALIDNLTRQTYEYIGDMAEDVIGSMYNEHKNSLMDKDAN